jgi:hypothetical protein
MRVKSIAIALLVTTVLTGCGTSSLNGNNSTNVGTHSDSFTRLDISDEKLTAEDFIEVDENPQTVKQLDADNINHTYEDTYTSNVEVDLEKIDMTDIYGDDWFTVVSNEQFMSETYQWVKYAIYTYYNGNIPDNFSCNLDNEEDIIDKETNMIFTVEVHGENTTLHILMDTYNYKIIVTEV